MPKKPQYHWWRCCNCDVFFSRIGTDKPTYCPTCESSGKKTYHGYGETFSYQIMSRALAHEEPQSPAAGGAFSPEVGDTINVYTGNATKAFVVVSYLPNGYGIAEVGSDAAENAIISKRLTPAKLRKIVKRYTGLDD